MAMAVAMAAATTTKLMAKKMVRPAKVGDFKYYRRLGAEREIWAMMIVALIGPEEIGRRYIRGEEYETGG